MNSVPPRVALRSIPPNAEASKVPGRRDATRITASELALHLADFLLLGGLHRVDHGLDFGPCELRVELVHHLDALPVMLDHVLPERAVVRGPLDWLHRVEKMAENIITAQYEDVKKMRTWLCEWYDVCRPVPPLRASVS